MTLPINITFADTAPSPAKKYIGWRCLHVAEGGYKSDNGMPEIRPSLPYSRPVRMTEEIQYLSYDVMRRNPEITSELWARVHGTTVAFTNENGLPGRRDYINRRDLDQEYPKLMKALICGGMFIRGNVVGNDLQCIPGVHGIDANRPLPSPEEVIEKNWYFHAVTEYNGQVSHFPQGRGGPVLMIYILREVVTYPIKWFTPWRADSLPDPLKVYL